jgi:hypothetical protein
MRDSGSSPEDVYREAIQDGIDPIRRIRLIRAVHALTPRQAKEVSLRAQGLADAHNQSLSQIADQLEQDSASLWK